MGKDTLQRAVVVAAITILALLSLLPTVFRDSFQGAVNEPGKMGWFTRPIALGLDISGGVHLVYGVQSKEAVKSRLEAMKVAIRSELRTRKIAVAQANVGDDNTVQITLLTESFLEEAKKVIQEKFTDLTFSNVQTEGGRPKLIYGIDQKLVAKIEHDAIDQAVETLRSRVDQFGVTEPLIQRSGDDRIILQMPGVSDVAAVKKVVGSVAKLEFRLVPNSRSSGQTVTLKDKAGNPVVVEDTALMTGADVADARVDFADRGQVEVSLQLSPLGADTFARITAENVGRQLAIILDGVVYSSPVIRDAITGGRASISGGFTTDEAKQLKVVLKAGALPAPLEVLEERTVGPTLGLDSVKKGILSMFVGFAAIALFMAVYYKKSGLVAIATLLLNAILMLACLSLFGATLTLPGLAGLALTIGVAVDSNVIIFERIRDELRNGVGRDVAVHVGYEKAFGAIFDSNITTLLAGVVLYYFGTGPVRGFAVTLCIGIVTTLFCAVFVARLLFDSLELKGREDKLSI